MRARLVNEGLISDVRKDEIIYNDFDKNVNEYIYNLEDYVYHYRGQVYADDLEEMDDNEIVETEDFKKWIKYELEYRYDDVIDELSNLPDDNGNIKIWRRITVDEKWLKSFKREGKRLGIYWSFEKEASEPHWGYRNKGKNILVTFEAVINEKHVDWVSTIKANLNFNTGREEKEITLFKNTPIKLLGVEYNYRKQNMKPFQNKIFKA